MRESTQRRERRCNEASWEVEDIERSMGGGEEVVSGDTIEVLYLYLTH